MPLDILFVALVWLVMLVAGQGLVSSNVTILEQKNIFQLYPPLDQAVLCQNLTDKYGTPVLKAADDMVLPSLSYFRERGVAHGVDDCTQFSITLTTLRRKNDLNPSFVTLEFMRHNATSGGPALYSKPFYKKTFQWPTNNYLWQSDYLNRPWDSMFVFQLNEVGDDGVTRFNFRDTVNFMRPGETVWLSFYATLPFHMDQRFVSNSMQWNTLNNVSGSTPVQQSFDGGVPNHNFMFLDASDFLRQGFTQWTPAVTVEQAMQITPSTNNMAWQVSLLCLVDPALLPTPAPSPPSPTTWPPLVTDPPATVAPTHPVNNNDTMTPIWNDTVNGTGNQTTTQRQPISLHVLWLSLVPITLIVCGVAVAYFLWRQRRKIRYHGKPEQLHTNVKAGNPLHQHQLEITPSPKGGNASLASFFDSEVSLSSSISGKPDKTSTQYYFAHNNKSPIMTSSSVRLDYNNPFSRNKPNSLLQVTISEDDDDML